LLAFSRILNDRELVVGRPHPKRRMRRSGT
jgi:hypothetical protein